MRNKYTITPDEVELPWLCVTVTQSVRVSPTKYTLSGVIPLREVWTGQPRLRWSLRA